MGEHDEVTPHPARYARHPLPKGEGCFLTSAAPSPAKDMCNDQRQPRRGAIRMAGTEKSTFRRLTRGPLTCWGCEGRSAG